MHKCKNTLGNTAGAGKLLDSDQTMRSGGVSLVAVSGRGFLVFRDPFSLKPRSSHSFYWTSVELKAPMIC